MEIELLDESDFVFQTPILTISHKVFSDFNGNQDARFQQDLMGAERHCQENRINIYWLITVGRLLMMDRKNDERYPLHRFLECNSLDIINKEILYFISFPILTTSKNFQ